MDKARLSVLCELDVGGITLGEVQIDSLTLDHAETAMRQLPAEVQKPATRRQYAQVIRKVCEMAVYPLRIVERNPLPKGFLPKVGKPPAYAYLYPAEEAALLAYTEAPPGYRVLFGFLAREGTREGEALGLRWSDIDLEHGVVTLDENKTDDPRAWALNPDVTRALQAWRKVQGKPKKSAPVFVDGKRPIPSNRLAEVLREYLTAAGVSRAELYARTANRSPLRVHDLRGTFVTLSLASGRSETWVADRTGHKSSQMINRYRRAARGAAELGLGWLKPMDFYIPELSPVPGIVAGLRALFDCPSIAPELDPPKSRNPVKTAVSRDGIEPPTRGFSIRQPDSEPSGNIKNTGGNDSAVTHRPPSAARSGQSWGNAGAMADLSLPQSEATHEEYIAACLGRALQLASEAGEWRVVATLAHELEARRRARVAPDVTDLEAERAKRKK